jgi:hypothetical protein
MASGSNQLSGAAAARTAVIRRPGGTSESLTCITGPPTEDVYSRLDTVNRFLKSQSQLSLNVIGNLRQLAGPNLGKKIVEQLRKSWSLQACRIETLKRKPEAGLGSLLKHAFVVVAMPIIETTLLRIAQDFVGLDDSIKAFSRNLIARVNVGMVFASELPVSLPNVVDRRGLTDSKNDVKLSHVIRSDITEVHTRCAPR